MKLGQCIDIAQAGLDAWKAKPHNAQWWRRIDHTPIPNDIVVCIARAFADVLASSMQPAQTGAVGSVPGWKLVPVEPTEEMCRAGAKANDDADQEDRIWADMLAASPTPPQAVTDVGGGELLSVLRISRGYITDQLGAIDFDASKDLARLDAVLAELTRSPQPVGGGNCVLEPTGAGANSTKPSVDDGRDA